MGEVSAAGTEAADPGYDASVPYNLNYFLDLDQAQPEKPSGRGQLGHVQVVERQAGNVYHDDLVNMGGDWISVLESEEVDSTTKKPVTPAKCRYELKNNMMLVGGGQYWISLVVDNPSEPRKVRDDLNEWTMTIVQNVRCGAYDTPTCSSDHWTTAGDAVPFGIPGGLQRVRCPSERLSKLQNNVPAVHACPVQSARWGSEEPDRTFAPNFAVLGKLANEIIVPQNWAAGQHNTLYVFFKTEQEAGTIADNGAVILVEEKFGEQNFPVLSESMRFLGKIRVSILDFCRVCRNFVRNWILGFRG